MQFEEKPLSARRFIRTDFPSGDRSGGTTRRKGQAQRDLIFHNGAVAVLPITDEGKTILVKQYRKGDREDFCRDPAGSWKKEKMTDPQAAALRELEEEIGYTADLELLYDFYSAIGFCNERIQTLCCDQLGKGGKIHVHKMRMRP